MSLKVDEISGRVPYFLVLRRYWRALIGTCGAWFLYDFVRTPIVHFLYIHLH